MTAYNRENFIAQAIESVLHSSYKNFELIIVDDCSTDNTFKIAERYSNEDERINVFRNTENLSQFPNRNKAAAFAKGEFIVNVDSDDTIKPDALEYIIKQFNHFPNAQFALVYGQDDIKIPTSFQPYESIRKHFYKSNHLLVGPGGTVIKTEFFKKIGGFPTCYGPAGDCYYNIKAAANGEVILFPYIFFNYRMHGDQEFFRTDSYLYNNYLYFEDVLHLPELPLSSEEKEKLQRKNKRKFVLNTLMYFKNSRNLKKTFKAYKIAGFTFKDFWNGILKR